MAVASNDNEPDPNPFYPGSSKVTFNAVTGTTYWIAVDSAKPGFVGRGDTFVVFEIPPAVLPPAPADVPQRLMDTRPGVRPGIAHSRGPVRSCRCRRLGYPSSTADCARRRDLCGLERHGCKSFGRRVLDRVSVWRPTQCVKPEFWARRGGCKPCHFGLGHNWRSLHLFVVVGRSDRLCESLLRRAQMRYIHCHFRHRFECWTRVPAVRPLMVCTAWSEGLSLVFRTSYQWRRVLNVPATVETVVMNVTAVYPTTAGYVSVYPCGQQPPDAVQPELRRR